MKLSIITVSYNSEKTIEDTILSVLSQDYENIEYIIIDGGSNDRTCEIIKKYKPQISFFISEPDKGIYDAMNKGIKKATGAVVGILNSDDFYANEQVLSSVMQKFDSNVDGVYADLVYVDATNTDKVLRKWISGSYVKDSFLKGWMPPHPTFFVRKEVYEKYGMFNTILRSAADYEFMLRVIHKFKIRLTYLPQVIVRMRAGGESNASLSNRIKANKEDRKAWELNGLKPNTFTLIRKPLSKVLQFIKK
jgi:glycosyltransferase involved in cell wall biosynthesis